MQVLHPQVRGGTRDCIPNELPEARPLLLWAATVLSVATGLSYCRSFALFLR